MKRNRLIKNIDLDDLIEFVENGSIENADPGLLEYYRLLEQVRGLWLRFESDTYILNHLQVLEKLSEVKAKQILADSKNYFYSNNSVRKVAYINLYAERLDNSFNLAIQLASTTDDVVKASKIIPMIAKLRELDKPEKEEKQEEAKEFNLITARPEDLGLEKANRNELKKIALEYLGEDATENKIQVILEEAEVEPFKLRLHEQKEIR